MDLAALVQTSPHAVVVVQADGVLVWGNDAAMAVLSLGDRYVAGDSLVPLLAPRHRARAQQLLAGVAGGARGGPVYLRLSHEPEQWVAVRGAPTPEGYAQLAVADVTEQVLARRRLRSSERRFRAAFDVGVTGQAVLDEHDRVVQVNAALAALLGRSQEELLGVRPAALVHEDDRSLLRQGSEAVRAALRLLGASGEVRHVLVTTRRLDDEDRPLLFVQVEDVTERRTSEQRLRHLALHDPLTDLPGRPLVLSRLEAALARPDAGLTAVLFVDLDGFKLVNDALGHAAGDRVLVEAAARLRDALRPDATVGRFGGDEFLVVCPGLADRDEGLAVARRIERAVSTPFPYAGDEVLVSASVGVVFAEPGTDPRAADALVHDADTAMYRAKQLGKRRFEVFDHAMRERAVERARVEQLLSRAVAEDRVVVHYQPLVDLPSRRIVGLEALMRVRDDDGGLLQPAAFLDVAAESGLLPSMDDAVLERAARAAVAWRDELGCDLEMAVNVCAAQVTSELPAKVDRVLRESGLPAERLVLELTEQALVTSAAAAGLALQRLADRGVRLAIDDFGTGWASLTYLRRFPIGIVKIDRTFVAGLPDEKDDHVIVDAVIDLARRLGLSCVAEGVETERQYEALRVMDPPLAQGYLFSRPVPPEDVPALVARRAL
ncbi:MAG: hypothetical protein JWO60_3086 [Frankiales bacterium]|nr:hypothetical protein [Frankiales bacterium]